MTDNRNKFWKGVLVGALVTAFAGLIIVGVATGISVIGRTVIDNQVQTKTVEEEGPENRAADQNLNFKNINQKMSLLQQIISEYYLFEEDPKMVEAGIYSGMMAGLLDPYSVYYTEEDFQQLIEDTEGIYCGIGAMVSQERATGLVTVTKVFKGSPSEEAGMLPGDLIYKVEGVEANSLDLDLLVSQHIRGEEGSFVGVTVFRQSENDYVDLQIQRRQIEVPTVEHQMLENKNGYILVSQFDDQTPHQFQQAVDELEEAGMEKLIIDLRNNPGGVLDSVVEMAAYILPEDRQDGMIVYTEDKNGNGDQYFCKDGKIECKTYDGKKDRKYPKQDGHQVEIPIAVLMNENSASASEVFAGALKDYEWATLVGTTSFGKGIVQNLIPLGDGTAVKLTVSHYFTPSGFDLHGKGIEPDVEVELNEELKTKVAFSMEEDNQLQKAIEVLQDK